MQAPLRVLSHALLALVAVAAASFIAPARAVAQSRDERRREQTIEKLAKKFGIPESDLTAAGADRYVAREAETRRALLTELGRTPRGTCVPLIVDAALQDADFENRRAAVKLLSVIGLEGDRSLFLESILPALPRLQADKSELIFLDGGDELNRLHRWFGCDAEVAPLLERTFKGANLRLAQRAFQALLDVKNPELRRGMVLRAIVEVLDPRARFGVFDRKRAVLAVAEHRDAATPAALAGMLHDDGTIAVEIAQVLGKLGDTSVLPILRRACDRTASHKLRLPAYDARGRLGDELLLVELQPAFDSDHEAIQKAVIEGLAGVKDAKVTAKVDQVLARLAQTVTDGTLRRAVALTRLRRGDPGDVDFLRPLLEGAAADATLAGQILDVEHAAATPLVVVIAQNAAEVVAGPRGRAVDLLGERAIATDVSRELLRKLQEGGPTTLKLRAAASLLQLGAADGVAAIESALIDFDVVTREDVVTGAGTARRFTGSPLSDVMARLARARTTTAAPLLARWLKPPLAPAPPAGAPPPADAAGRGTAGERGGRGPAAPAAPPPPPAFLAHQFVRRAAVEALGELAVALLEQVKSATPETRPALEADLERATAALVVRLDDPAGTVRNAAVRVLARISGQDLLPPGAPLKDEEEVRTKLRAWSEQRSR